MANILNKEKQVAIIAALSEGNSIRGIERMTGVHRDTIMRLGVRIGKGCARIMDEKMRGLECKRLQLDEIWGFIGKKQRRIDPFNNPNRLGDVWTFCAIDADSKAVPCFRVGSRDRATATEFVGDLAGRLNNRVQISTDGLAAYIDAIEKGFGASVDYGQIVKSFEAPAMQTTPERRYSPPQVVSVAKYRVAGDPDPEHISTSYVERLNASTRLHMKRLSRLTLAFSRKFENFEAAVALHFAAYNFVRRHRSIRMSPAMALGIERAFWTYDELVERAS